MKLINNDEVDKLKLNNDEVDKEKTLKEKQKNYYSEEEVYWYTIFKIYLIRKYTHFEIMLSINDEVASTSSQIV